MKCCVVLRMGHGSGHWTGFQSEKIALSLGIGHKGWLLKTNGRPPSTHTFMGHFGVLATITQSLKLNLLIKLGHIPGVCARQSGSAHPGLTLGELRGFVWLQVQGTWCK